MISNGYAIFLLLFTEFDKKIYFFINVGKNSLNLLVYLDIKSKVILNACFFIIILFITEFDREINILTKVGKNSFNYILDFKFRF